MIKRYFTVAMILGTVSSVLACTDSPPGPVPAVATTQSYVGSESCRDCHDDEFAAWRSSHHELAMQPASEDTVLGDFSDVTFRHNEATARFFRRDGDFLVAAEDERGSLQEFQVAYTFGIAPLQQYLVRLPGGRMQALPFAWDSREDSAGGQRWFHLYPEEEIVPGDELHWTGMNFNWNFMCAECHSTNVEMNYDADRDQFDTQFSEVSVGCESCHGPGSRHTEQARSSDFDQRKGLIINLDDHAGATWVMDNGSGIARRSIVSGSLQKQPEACGRCHARRSVLAPVYRYGRSLADTHMPALLTEPLYFADGQIHDEVYVYGSFLQSRMYAAGVTCTDCHDPHSGGLKDAVEPNQVCAACHLPARFASAAHTRHGDTDIGCVDCHMPARAYMQIDSRRDHSFRVPRPDLSARIGSPDVCTACHTDKDLNWAAAKLKAWGVEPDRHFGAALHAGRSGYANPALVGTAQEPTNPGIVRATALSLLQAPMQLDAADAIRSGLRDSDPLVRVGALRASMHLRPAERLDWTADLLNDPVLAVRVEAVRTLAEFHDILPNAASRRFAEAEQEYRASFEFSSNRPESLTALGDLDRDLGNQDAAARYYRRALRLAPDYLPARLSLAEIVRLTGNETEVGEILRAGLERSPEAAALHHSIGLHHVRSGRASQGLENLRRAAEIEPSSARYTYVFGVALNSLGFADEAIRVLEAARERFPGDYDISWALATMHRDRGNTGRAIEIVQRMTEQFPNDRNVAALRRELGNGR